jgi:hypothetical protein
LDKNCSMVIFEDCADLDDMHILTHKIKEDIEFQKGINVKLNPEFFSSLETELISSVWTLETNNCLPP